MTSAFPLALIGAVVLSYALRVALNPFLSTTQRSEAFARHAGVVLLITYLFLPKVRPSRGSSVIA